MAGKPLTTKRRGRGEGTVERRGPDRWRLRIYVGRDPATGRPRQMSKTVKAANKTAALQAMRAFALEAADERSRASEASVARLLDEWRATSAFADLRPTTRQDYARVMRNHLIPALGKLRLDELTAHHLDRYYTAKKATLKPKTINLHHSILSGALQQAVRWGWIPTNPARSAQPPKVEKYKGPTPAAEQVRRLIDAAVDDAELAIAVIVAAITGARRGELCGLRWPDVDWERGLLTFRRQRVPVEGGDITGPLKNGQERTLAIGELGIAALTRYRQVIASRALDTSIEPDWDGWLISRDCGYSPMNARGLGTKITELGKAAGVEVTPHAFRRFAGTQLVGAGVDVMVAASRLGHDPAILLKVYAQALPERDRAAAAGLEGLVLPVLDSPTPAIGVGP